MKATRSRTAASALVAFLVASASVACGDVAKSSPTPADGPPRLAVGDMRFTCGAFPFPPDLLAGPGDDERGLDPAAAALREHLATPNMDIDLLPDVGWHQVGNDGLRAEFIAPQPDGTIAHVQLELAGAEWRVTGWGGCQARLQLPPGLGDAEWAFDPTQPVPGPDSQVFDALVTEVACNSGQPADGRIVGPAIVTDAQTVLVIFGVLTSRVRASSSRVQATRPRASAWISGNRSANARCSTVAASAW
jgi:hypothetical protein